MSITSDLEAPEVRLFDNVFIFKFARKLYNYAIYKFMWTLFYLEPKYGLKFLYFLKLDIALYSVPLFLLTNKKALTRLKKIRKKGLNPTIILWTTEGDDRFVRLSKLAEYKNDERTVWFKFSVQICSAETIYFESYDKLGADFYDDARQKYILPLNDKNRENYRKFIGRLFDGIEKHIGKIEYFFCGSNNDRYVVELITVLQQRGGHAVVCEREGTSTPYAYKLEGECFKKSKSIQADYIFTANINHQKMFEYARISEKTVVKSLGELDTDFWFHWDRKFLRKEYAQWDKFEKKVLFLTFGLRNYVEPYLYPQYPELSWIDLLKDTEDVILNFAKDHPNILVFYKMGHLEDNNKKFIERAHTIGLKNIVPLNRTFSCNELILYSDLIIGFQTTAIFEAMFSDKIIFFLYWNIPDVLDRKYQMLPVADSGACHDILSKEQFLKDLYNWAQENQDFLAKVKPNMHIRKKTRELMFQDADGRVAERYFEEINKIIQNSKETAAYLQ